MKRLNNKTAVITGGTTGIGFATAQEFIQEGAKVIITGRNQETLTDEQFDINVKGVFFTVQKLTKLLNQGASVIINASAVNTKGAATGSIYFATKAAVRSFARSLAAVLGDRLIRVNAISPGIVRTEFQGKMDLPKEAVEGFIEMVKQAAPLHREGKVNEIAKAVVFLASDESSYMSASDLVVDGGYMNI